MSFKIDCNNNMTVTKSDKAFIDFRLSNAKLKEGYNVIFTVKGEEEKALFTKQINSFSTNGIATIELNQEDTHHNPGKYTYNVRVMSDDGIDETVICGDFTIIDGV